LRAWSRRSRTTQPRIRRPPPIDLSPTPSELTLSEGRSSTGLPLLSLREPPQSRTSLELPDCAEQTMGPPKLSRWQHLRSHPRDGAVVRFKPLPNAFATIRFRPSNESNRWLGCPPSRPRATRGLFLLPSIPLPGPHVGGPFARPSPIHWPQWVRGHPGQPGELPSAGPEVRRPIRKFTDPILIFALGAQGPPGPACRPRGHRTLARGAPRATSGASRSGTGSAPSRTRLGWPGPRVSVFPLRRGLC